MAGGLPPWHCPELAPVVGTPAGYGAGVYPARVHPYPDLGSASVLVLVCHWTSPRLRLGSVQYHIY